MGRLEVDADIRVARTIDAWAYGEEAFRRACTRVFPSTWHGHGEDWAPGEVASARPFDLLPGALDEPLVETVDEGGARHVLGNVCTHRANLVVREACRARALRCGYHGRSFSLDGRFRAMPAFEGAAGFPSPDDDLPHVPSGSFGPLRLVSLAPRHDLGEALLGVHERLGFLLSAEPTLGAPRAADEVRTYDVAASWALYVENYLEGLHVPFVHRGLASALDLATYRTVLLPWGTIQIASAREGEPAFDLPAGHPEAGQRIAAFYAWVYPATMINAYPWGLSVNLVRPRGPDRVAVTFVSYVARPSLRDRGAGADLDRVELEDEAIVQAVQRGVRSRLYRGGRFSPTAEVGVHAFHRLLAADLSLP